MNRPEGISPDRYPLKTRGTIALGVDCVGEVGETFKVNGVEFYSPEYLQRAIQSSVEAERAKALKFASAAMIREGKDDWAKGYRCAAADILDAIKGA